MKIIYYYQTFCGLEDILKSEYKPDIIHLSSIHFGENYIHLNNNPPNDPIFDSVWSDCEKAGEAGVKIVLMIGGAGSAYYQLFSDYNKYYALLKETLSSHPVITGVDLDIEEECSLDNIKKLMLDIRHDFPHFSISMAPVQSSLEEDVPGMGGFIYKDLWLSPEGSLIDYFNGQFYGDFSLESFETCVKNGYPSDKIVIGMLSSEDFSNCITELIKIKNKYPDFCGVFNWEYFNSPPNPDENPNLWCETIIKKVRNE